jgi:opacity protein-like surface antigen
MKTIMMAAAVAALLAAPAFAQTLDQARGTLSRTQASDEPGYAWRGYGSGQDSPYRAFGAVTPFGSPTNGHDGGSRDTALRQCSIESRKYTQTTWGTMDMHQHRACMAQRGQME